MSIFTGIVVYLLVWWVMIFTVLPWGLTRDEDGTPRVPHLGRKVLITTGVSLVVWAGIYLLIESDVISFREMAAGM